MKLKINERAMQFVKERRNNVILQDVIEAMEIGACIALEYSKKRIHHATIDLKKKRKLNLG